MKNPLKSSVAPKDFNVTVNVSPGKTMLLLVVNECLDGPTWKNKFNQLLKKLLFLIIYGRTKSDRINQMIARLLNMLWI